MYTLIVLLGLGMIYLTGRGINGRQYGFGRFLIDLSLACMGLILIFGLVFIFGGLAK